MNEMLTGTNRKLIGHEQTRTGTCGKEGVAKKAPMLTNLIKKIAHTSGLGVGGCMLAGLKASVSARPASIKIMF